MLDLNLKIFSSYIKDQDQDRKMISTTSKEDSYSSSSSTDSASSDTFISFGILKGDDDVVPPPPPKETGDLFPMVEDSHWLKLCSSEGNNTEKIVKKKKSRRGPRSRSSQYRGVTFYRRTGRWESHIWDCGKQVYLGGFDTAYAAARAYDRAAIKFRGLEADINFVVDDYKHDIDKMKNLNKVEFVQILRRESASFGRGSSKYKGLDLQNCTQFKTHDHIHHLFQNRGWDANAMKCGAHIKGNGHNDLDLSLGISSMNQSTLCLLGKQSSKYLPMTTTKPLKTIAASSGFPFIGMTSSSSSTSTCLDP